MYVCVRAEQVALEASYKLCIAATASYQPQQKRENQPPGRYIYWARSGVIQFASSQSVLFSCVAHSHSPLSPIKWLGVNQLTIYQVDDGCTAYDALFSLSQSEIVFIYAGPKPQQPPKRDTPRLFQMFIFSSNTSCSMLCSTVYLGAIHTPVVQIDISIAHDECITLISLYVCVLGERVT